MTDIESGRRLTPADLIEHWDSRVAVDVLFKGKPELRLRIDQPNARLTLRAPSAPGIMPPVNRLAHVAAKVVVEDGSTYLAVSTDTDRSQAADCYSMLIAVADRVQDQGVDPLVALEEVLSVWKSILASRGRLDVRAEVGLFGELLVAKGTLRADAARFPAWRGGLSEEHDFGFSVADLEVKTTSGERRSHWISGLNQLVETEGTPLWVLSLQITRGGDEQGATLPSLIDEVTDLAGPPGRHRVEQNLAGAGWNERQRDLYVDRWRLRTSPLLLKVDDDFPRLTPALLSEAMDISLLRQVNYEVDLADRSATADPPPLLTKIVNELEGPDG